MAELSRISRGFHRIGIVVSAPIAVASIALGIMAFQERSADIASDQIRAALAADVAAKAQARAKQVSDAPKKASPPPQSMIMPPEAEPPNAPNRGARPMAPIGDLTKVTDSELLRRLNVAEKPADGGPWTKYHDQDRWWESAPLASESQFVPRQKSLLEYFAISLLTLAFSITAYLAVRSVGWIISGFMRGPDLAN